jgi:branched-chain amino acid transport system substrate-binding protein
MRGPYPFNGPRKAPATMWRKAIALVTCIGLAIFATGCGNRLPQSTIEAAARGSSPAAVGNDGLAGSAAATGSNSVIGAPSSSTGVASDNSDSVPGSTGPAGSASSGGSDVISGGTSQSQPATSGANGTQSSTGSNSGNSAPGSPGGGSSGSSGQPSGGSSPAASGSPVVLGNIGDYSGVVAPVLAPAEDGLEVWAKYVNAHGGLNGHPVQLIIANTQGDPSTDEIDVQQMIEQDHVIAFVSNMDVLDYTGSEQYLVQHDIPAIGGYGAPFMYSEPNFFPDGPTLADFAALGLPAAIHEGKKNIGIVYCIETPLCGTEVPPISGPNGTVAESGGKLVYTAAASLTSPSFTSQCLGAQSAGVQVMEVVMDAASVIRFAQDCALQGFDPLYETVSVAGLPSLDTVPQLNGLVLPVSTFPWIDTSTPGEEEFQTAMKDYDSAATVGPSTAIGWTAGQLVSAGSADLGSAPTGAQLMAGLDTLKNTTLNGLTPGPLTFHAGSNATIANCVYIVVIHNGGWVLGANGAPVCTS